MRFADRRTGKSVARINDHDDLCRLLEGKPTTLVAAMINVAVTGLYVDTIANGIRLEAWREPQLSTIQEQLPAK